MFGLLTLSTEILQEITANAENSDRKSLRASCSRLRDVVEPQLFSHLQIDVYRREQTVLPLLGAFAHGSRIAQFVQSLAIHSCTINPGYHFGRSRTAKDAINSSLAFQRDLSAAICSLCSLRRVKWDITDTDLLWTRQAILNALASLDDLSDLSIVISGPLTAFTLQPASLFPFQRLRNLQTLSLSAPIGLENIWGPAKQLIAQCPDLRSLALVSTDVEITGPRLSLADAVKHTPSHLTSLFIHGCEITPDFAQICKEQLHSLSTLRVVKWSPSVPEVDLWSVLTSERIFAPSLDVCDTSPSLMAHLLSHPGLKSLRLTGRWNRTTEFDGGSEILFTTILPRHADSLRELVISSACFPEFNFNETQATAISRCYTLTRLQVCLPDTLGNIERATLLMNTVVSLPLLTMLEIVQSHTGYSYRADDPCIIRGVTDFGPIKSGILHPSLQILYGQEYFGLRYSQGDNGEDGMYKFHLIRRLADVYLS